MANRSERGSFIVFEGLDRCGKSTQCARLAARLGQAGRAVQTLRFPDRSTPIGQMIDGYLRQTSELEDHAVHLLFAANRWEKSADIERAVEAGTTVLSDRYGFSGTAFTAAKQAMRGERDPMASLVAVDRGLPLPDLVIFLSPGDEEASLAGRAGFGAERYEHSALQTEVHRQFLSLVQPYFELIHGPRCWVSVDATGSVDLVEQRIWDVVENHLRDFRPQPLGKLWVP